MLLALALPYLPPPFPSIILNVLKYVQIGGMFLDDVAGLLVGVGFLILFAGWSVTGP
jgi:GET complex subunit GET2